MAVSSTTEGRSDAARPAILGLLTGAGLTRSLPPLWDGMVSSLLVLVRFFLALPFLSAGLARLNNWGSQSFLFEHEHPLPLLGPATAAWVTTAAELILPILLVAGLFTRVAALGLTVMAAAILLLIGGAYAIPAEQLPWIAAGLALVLVGPGRISLDHAAGTVLTRRPGVPVMETLVALFLVLVLLEKAGAWGPLLGLETDSLTPLGWFF